MGSKKHKDKRDSKKHKKRRSRSRERERDSHRRSHKSSSSRKEKERSPECPSPRQETQTYEEIKLISDDSASSRNFQESRDSDKHRRDLSDDEFDIDKLLESKLFEKTEFSSKKSSKRLREEDREELRRRQREDFFEFQKRQSLPSNIDYTEIPGLSIQVNYPSESQQVKSEVCDSPPTVKPDQIPFITDVEIKREPEEIEPCEEKQEPQLSLSIEETNKLRAKLGLKPLAVRNESSGANEGNVESEPAKPKEVFVKTENINEVKKSEALREKLRVMKEKRAIEEQLKKMKGVADSDSEDETASDWVLKHQKIMEEKEKAEKQAKLLEEMDAEFGVSALIEEQFHKKKAYTSNHLKGLTVHHDINTFTEGKQVILTLKDKGVLDEDEDVLENVNIVESERYARNVENKKKKPGYVAYDEPEYDEFGILQKKNLLSKYDEEIEGEKKKTFKIGTQVAREQELEMIRRKLQQENKMTLEMPELKVATEYYTPEEMVKFKKPKKKKKVRKSLLKADDLLVHSFTEEGKDLGSRKRRKIVDSGEIPFISEPIPEEPDLPPVIDEDQTDTEFYNALNKAKKLKERKVVSTAPEKVLEILSKTTSNSASSSNTDTKDGNNIELNSVAEFCRTLGDIPTYGLSGNRDEEVEDLMDYEKELEDSQKQDLDSQNRGTWNEVDIDEKPAEISVRENEPILEEEPDISSGIAGALKLAMKKGYLDKEMKKASTTANSASNLQAQSYTIEEKFYEDDKFGKRDRYTGPVQEFREKMNYKPDVKLEYIDDSGRLLTAKEAFRYLSHKFHGKGPGKNKVDKRMKKLEQDTRLKQMSSTDTPLNTVKLLQAKQKETQSPYIVLSGGNKTLTQTMISKTKL